MLETPVFYELFASHEKVLYKERKVESSVSENKIFNGAIVKALSSFLKLALIYETPKSNFSFTILSIIYLLYLFIQYVSFSCLGLKCNGHEVSNLPFLHNSMGRV